MEQPTPSEKGKAAQANNTFNSALSDATHREIIEQSEVGMFVLVKDRFVFINSSLARLLECDTPDVLLGTLVWELARPEDQVRLKAGLMKAREDESVTGDLEFRFRKKDQTEICLKMVFFESVQKGALLGNVIDITDHQAIIKRLQESRQQFHDVLEEVEDGIMELSLTGRMTWCNTAVARIFRYSREELIGLDYRFYMDEDTARRVYQAYNRVYKTGKPNKAFTYEITGKDGIKRIIENSITPKKSSEQVLVGFRSVVREVTVRIKAEEELSRQRSRLSAIFSSVKDGIITVDNDMRIIEANGAAGTICGIAVGQIEGQSFLNCASHCSKSCQDVLLETVKWKTSVNEYHIECNHQFRPGQEVILNSSLLVDQNRDHSGAVLLIRDVTRLLLLERELKDKYRFHALVGKSKKMQNIYKLLEDLSDIDTTVLITGESGTGKGLAAKALHYNGNRAFAPFITVSCSALPENLLESELFGHVKGAFTGAIKDKQGRFQVADGGVILLDEIGDVSPLIQLKLLRVLQEKEFERVGDSQPIKADVRVIACTNVNLEEKIRKGEFREDLYYRLKVMEIKIPPLRERLDDIPLLVDHFCRLFSKNFKKEIEGVTGDVYMRFMNYDWPGNIRELEHAIEHAFVLCRNNSIGLEHIPLELRESVNVKRVKSEKTPAAEKKEILSVLQKTDWNKAKAARILNIDRSTLYRKIRLYQLPLEANKV
ncbi:MAG: sigma 54-interacting transcriptional regulator [Deltaproteobacteria bacterium]|nr:sigma 54-interacting transcriptional regulator [Deltaproteobacteria bacterium]MBT4640467.1 sigma 54-interacting transcriptional regulator [Deltaproteobacteria bacterium]MBT6502925.1 sigma 54-interacting transcriptional regulator [Deltaproteobacteria bacterium]MBT7154428.1 sigma 54-interacting transcriptional regulator [Deltaproteobacteria bacterium]MBT7710424.1 sigma 54-interacting transcriptional regulator [Deltaproteobacteria bacterium]